MATEKHAATERALFLNRVKSLFNIDGDRLPELSEADRITFVRDPVRYFMRANDEHAAAIWREIEKRQAKPAAFPAMHPVLSTNIVSAGHDGTDLLVAFKSGGTYRYQGVPVATYEALLEAKSPGSYLHANIRDRFPAEKIEGKS